MEFRYGPYTVRLNMPDRGSLLSAVQERFHRGEGFALATINLDHLVKLRSDAAFARAYAAHDLVVADGNPIVWLSKLAARPVELVPGSDMVEPVARLAAREGVRVAMVGSTDETLTLAKAYLERIAPGLQVVFREAPAMGFDAQGEEAGRILDRVRESGAGLCYVALGAPRQEIFAARGLEAVPGCGFMSIGAGLDFLAGHQKRAPAWVRRIAMEWLWRMVLSPARLGPRYARCAAILPNEGIRALGLRRRGPQA